MILAVRRQRQTRSDRAKLGRGVLACSLSDTYELVPAACAAVVLDELLLVIDRKGRTRETVGSDDATGSICP